MVVYVGTSGWQYKHWKGGFYPESLRVASWLEYYSERFATVEVNNAFYRLPERSVFESWRERTPADFVVAVKASRYLSHVRRLRDPAEPVARLMERVEGLGRKTGPILLQLPPDLRCSVEDLDGVLGQFPPGARVAVEFRHDSWWNDEVAAILRSHKAALCLADARGPRTALWRTADWGYVRFHGGRAVPPPCYGRGALETWASRVHELFGPDADVFVYFNNDERGCAPRDARRFARAAEAAGLRPTRVPRSAEAPVDTA